MITYDSIAAMKLNRYIFNMNTELNTVNEQIKTGSSINKASDDPSVFNLTARVKGYSELYSQANSNVQNGITIVDTATSAISSMQGKLKSIKSILEEATAEDVTEEERATMQKEVDALIKEIYDIKQNTGFTALESYGGIQIFEKIKDTSSTSSSSSSSSTVSTESSTFIESVTQKTRDDFTGIDTEDVGYETYTYGTSKADGKVYYFVENADQLENISVAVSEGETDKNFILMGDISLSDLTDWGPIGDAEYMYEGIFDGNGYTISDLTIQPGITEDVGLFGKISGATIKNVALENVSVSANRDVGALVGEAYNSEIINSYVKGGSVEGHIVVGGLVGYNNGSTIEKSYAELDNVTVANNNGGGLVGTSYQGEIYRSYASTNVQVTDYYAGGLVGVSTLSTIENSYAQGSVSAREDVGGFIGSSATTTVKNSYTASKTSGTDNVGGFIGELSGNASTNVVNNSFFDTEATTQSEGVGYYHGSTAAQTATLQGATTSAMKTPSTFTNVGWDTDIWHLSSGKYPSLKEEIKDPFPEKPDEPTYYGALKPVDGPIRIQSGSDDSTYVTIDATFDFDDNFNFWVTNQDFAKQSLKNLANVQEQLTEKTYELSLQKIQLNSEESSTSNQVTCNNNVLTALTGVDTDELETQRLQLLSDITNAKALRTSTINLNAQVCKTLVYGAIYGISSQTASVLTSSAIMSSILTN